LAVQVGSAPRRSERTAKSVDEIEQCRDSGLHLLARHPPRVPDEREQLTRRIDLLQERGEPDEATPHRRVGRWLDRASTQEVHEVEDADAKASHPVADRSPRDTVISRHGSHRHSEPGARNLDHVDDRTRLTRQRLARKRALEVTAVPASRQPTAQHTGTEEAREPRSRELELAPPALRAHAVRQHLGRRVRDAGGVRGTVPRRYVYQRASATAGCRPRQRPRSLLL
jgi:hypothetical protein